MTYHQLSVQKWLNAVVNLDFKRSLQNPEGICASWPPPTEYLLYSPSFWTEGWMDGWIDGWMDGS